MSAISLLHPRGYEGWHLEDDVSCHSARQHRALRGLSFHSSLHPFNAFDPSQSSLPRLSATELSSHSKFRNLTPNPRTHLSCTRSSRSSSLVPRTSAFDFLTYDDVVDVVAKHRRA